MNEDIIRISILISIIMNLVLFSRCSRENLSNFKVEETFKIMSIEDMQYIRAKVQMKYEDSIGYERYFKNISHFGNKNALYYSQWLPSYNNFYHNNLVYKNSIQDLNTLVFAYNLNTENNLPIIQDTLLILLAKIDFAFDTFWILVSLYNYNKYSNFVSTDISCNWRIEISKDTSLTSTIQIEVQPRIFYEREDNFGYTTLNYFFTKPKSRRNKKIPVDLILKIQSKNGQFEFLNIPNSSNIIPQIGNSSFNGQWKDVYVINKLMKKEPFYKEKLVSVYSLALVEDEQFNVFNYLNNGIHIDVD